IEVEFTNLIPTAKALYWVGGILNNLNVNLGLYKINKILYIDSSNAKDRILNPNLPAKNRYIDIRYK
ncbi:hypothetical protein OFB58_24875, partial [Escherichia coli]|nr:hypothetical protein [Escherichia coli]